MRNDTKMGTVHALFTNAGKMDRVFRNVSHAQGVPFLSYPFDGSFFRRETPFTKSTSDFHVLEEVSS